MKKENFDELIKSIKEGGKIMRGEIKPSRKWTKQFPKRLGQTPIVCPSCGNDTGFTQEEFMHYVATTDVLCPHCGCVILSANNGITW